MLTHGKAHKPEIDAFCRKAIDYRNDDCLLWPFGKTKAGYGMIRRDGKRVYVHRLLCRIRHGPAAKERPFAAHSCGNAACVNPSHIRWASHRENVADRIWHEKTAPGRLVKLTEDQVRMIKQLRGQKASIVARAFGVARPTIYSIWKGESWAWLT